MTDAPMKDQNVGHGHVFPRPDGVRARCGGPSICSECARDMARKAAEEYSAKAYPASNERTQAAAIANRLLDEPYADPDDDIRVLARQFERSQEEIERLQNTTILRDQIDSLMAQVSKLSAENACLRGAPETTESIFDRYPPRTLLQKTESGQIVGMLPDGTRIAGEPPSGPTPAQERDALAERCDWFAGRLQRVGDALQNLIGAGDQIEIPPDQLGMDPVFTVTGRLKDQRAFNRAMEDAREDLKDWPAEKTKARTGPATCEECHSGWDPATGKTFHHSWCSLKASAPPCRHRYVDRTGTICIECGSQVNGSVGDK